jgi:hypothetical protein
MSSLVAAELEIRIIGIHGDGLLEAKAAIFSRPPSMHAMHATRCCRHPDLMCRGCCSQGSACVYLHRIPTEEDAAYHTKMMGVWTRAGPAAWLFLSRRRLDVSVTATTDVGLRGFLLHPLSCVGFDIFGQEKRSEAEGFRKGAGTMERDNRTLYCNYEGAGSYDLPKVTQRAATTRERGEEVLCCPGTSGNLYLPSPFP